MKKIAAFVPLALFGLIVALFAVPVMEGKNPAIAPSALVGKPVPVFHLAPVLPDGKGLSDKDLKGAPALVNVFASWCVACVEEQEVLARIARTEKIYAINYKDKKDAARAWLARHGNPFSAVGFDSDGRAAIDWGVYGVPETFVVDRDGIVLYRHVGPVTEEDYEKIFKPLMEKLR